MVKLTEQEIRRVLADDLPPIWRRVERNLLDHLAAKLYRKIKESGALATAQRAARWYEDDSPSRILVIFLLLAVEEELAAIESLRRRQGEFGKRLARVSTGEERRFHVLEYARDLGASRRRLRGDRRAFARWFDADAVNDRYQRKLAGHERQLAFILGRVGAISARVFREEAAEAGHLWQRFELEKTIQPLLTYIGDSRVCIAAFRSLSTALRALPPDDRQGRLSEGVLQYVFRFAMEGRQQTWLQVEALGLLGNLSLDALATVLEKRLTRPLAGDDLFVRRRAVDLLGETLPRRPELADLFSAASRDASPFVRQALPSALRLAEPVIVAAWLPRLAAGDESPQVRGAALLAAGDLLERPELFAVTRTVVTEALRSETDPFVLRVACRVACQGQERLLVEAGDETVRIWEEAMTPALDALRIRAASLAVRRWAAMAREALWCAADPEARRLRERLARWLERVPPNRRKRLPGRLLAGVDQATLGRVLAVLGQEDFGCDLEGGRFGRHLTRGHLFRFRLWRLLCEFGRPSPDKRESFPHTQGRVFRGNLRAPTAIMAEMSETKVPGEPLFMDEEQGWRPYLPLVDELLSALDQNWGAEPTRIFTAEGVTEIVPPDSLFRRLRGRVQLIRNFRHYARLRNWQEAGRHAPDAYLAAIARLGIRVHFRAHPGAEKAVDPAVGRFFPAALPLLGGDLWPRVQSYFFSLYQNTLAELTLFVVGAVSLFIGRQLWLQLLLKRARRALPLVIGGWGTRGKSGTERLKVALFNALGYGIVAKTTGCEAMFLHSLPFGETREMFLFRPYDKATIWEQHNVTCLARKLRADVFLYECMALTPSFVRIVQRWMRDDLSTITNTYPDHEDLQGPAGIHIPQVMTNFIPDNAVLCTTEEQMLPILRVAARERGTRVRGVGWLEAGLLTPDVLGRFPYEEHPYNVALVLAMAEEMGIAPDFALKEMADRVVPDLGVLKSFPVAQLDGRRLEFVNGMSANERFATLANWRRMGFDRADRDTTPEIWITALVNNRGDRVPRSQAFARILVEDVSVDRIVLIGTNLSGLLGYLRDFWREHAAGLSLWPETGNTSPREILTAEANRLRMPVDGDQVRARLRAMLDGLAVEALTERAIALWREPEAVGKTLAEAVATPVAEAVAGFLADELRRLDEFRAFAARLDENPAPDETLDQVFRALLGDWFEGRLVVVENAHADGNQVIARIRDATPPGLLNRIMGMQNIKGTGLDFVYCWQAWERCHQACNLLLGDDPGRAEQGLRQLSAFQGYNLLCAERVRETIHQVRPTRIAQRELFQAELLVIEAQLEKALQRVAVAREATGSGGLLSWLVQSLEELMDAGDAVKRRKRADAILADLVDERISHARAAIELMALNKRQKGGWLLGWVQALNARFGRIRPDPRTAFGKPSEPG